MSEEEPSAAIPESGVVAPPFTLNAAATVHAPRIGQRSYFSSTWLRNAHRFLDEAQAIEAAHQGPARADPFHLGLVIASVQAAIAFLEANVNELYQDAADSHGTTGDGYIAPLPPAARESMAQLWQGADEGRKLGTLSKYQLMLTTAGLPRLNPGADPYQSAAAAIRLRNVLVHYQPETVWADEIHKLESQLRGNFPDSALMAGSGNAWWPSHCLGAGCADWAIHSVRAFTDAVAADLCIQPNYQRVSL